MDTCLNFESKCNDLQLPINPPVPDPPNTGININPATTLADIITQTEELYGNILESLIGNIIVVI